MSVICPECKRQGNADDLYCRACGTSLIEARRVTSTPPSTSASRGYRPSAEEKDFIPLALEPPGGGRRRWLFLGLGLLVLLVVGGVLAREWYEGNNDTDLADRPAGVDRSLGVAPSAATPIPARIGVTMDATATAPVARATPVSSPGTPVVSGGTVEASSPIDGSLPGDGTGGAMALPAEGTPVS